MLTKAGRAFHPQRFAREAGAGMIATPVIDSFPKTRLPVIVYGCIRQAQAVLAETGIAGEPVLLAVSGGSDSMALLEIASMLAPRLGLTLHVAHIDHRMRAASAAEEALVRAAAEGRGAVFHGAAIDSGRGDEDTMRQARYEALGRIAAEAGCRFILLGHTADDQIETVLFRFLRGAGFGGLAGMRAVRPPLVRPLLGIRRATLREFLKLRSVAWLTDQTNLSWRYARGRIRRTVIPAVEAAFGAGVLDHLLDVAPRWRSDDDFLQRETARLLAFASRGGNPAPELDLEALDQAHPALRARALQAWIAERTGHVPGSRELAGVELWLDAGQGSGIDLEGGRLEKRAGRLVTVSPSFSSAQMKMEKVDNAKVRADSSAARSTPMQATPAGEDGLLPPSEARVRFPRNP